jgi:hypothetical protein
VLTLSAWYGGQLVFKHGVRVVGGEEMAGDPEWKLPGDERLAEAFLHLQEAAEDLPTESSPTDA